MPICGRARRRNGRKRWRRNKVAGTPLAFLLGRQIKRRGRFPAPGAAALSRPPVGELACLPLPLAAKGVRPGQATGTNEVAALTRSIVQTSALNTETATC